MKKTFKILALCFTLLVIFCSVCFATDVVATSQEDVMLISEEDVMLISETSQSSEEGDTTTIPNTNSSIYEGNTNVLLNGYVNGNSFLVGQKITISGYVKGDLFVMANSLVIESGAEVTGTVFALANEMKISGKVSDVYALSQEFTLVESGFIARDLNLSANTVTFQGKVGRDVNLSTNTLSFDENVKNLIGGDLNYSTPNEVTIPENVVIGKINFEKMTVEQPSTAKIISNYVTNFFIVVLYATLVIILATLVTPNFAKKATYSMTKKPLISVSIGIGAIIFAPIISIILLFTVIFTYVGLSLLIAYILILSITIAILGMAIGNYFADKLKNRTKTKFILLSIASVTILWLLQQLPSVGGYISIFTVVFGLGIFVYSLFTKKALEQVKE